MLWSEALREYLYMAVPAVLQLVDATDAPLDVRAEALRCIGSLASNHNVNALASAIILALVRVLGGPYPPLRGQAMGVLYGLAYSMGGDYLIFEPTVRAVMRRQQIVDAAYTRLLQRLVNLEPLDDPTLAPDYSPPAPSGSFGRTKSDSSPGSFDGARMAPYLEKSQAADRDGAGLGKRFRMDALTLSKAWDAQQRSTAEDWQEWLRAFSLELLRESPSPALRCCAALAERSVAFSLELFNAAFFCCWDELLERSHAEEHMRGAGQYGRPINSPRGAGSHAGRAPSPTASLAEFSQKKVVPVAPVLPAPAPTSSPRPPTFLPAPATILHPPHKRHHPPLHHPLPHPPPSFPAASCTAVLCCARG
jgi:FKBP12-rapamycin complex-associated protein